jgi:NAD(P)-dependent dehydrogenase (short-subunit alcohol dehydrogenase family)
MSKEAISSKYLEETKKKYLNDNEYSYDAFVVGSDQEQNIGARIARKLRRRLWTVHEYDKNNWNPFALSEHGNHLSAIILANGYTHLDWIEDQPDKEIIESVFINLSVSMLAAKHFVQNTINNPWPKYIVFIGSMAYRSVLNGSAPYCAAKAGLAHFAKCIAYELAPKNYNVFCIHPSNTEGTPMTEKTISELQRYRKLNREQAEEYWGAGLLRQEWLQPEDIANVVDFVLSGKADYMSGSNIDLAGGAR